LKRYYLDLFSGIGGFALGAQWAGLEFDGHYFSEVDEYAISVYKKRFPDAIALGNITKIDCALLP
jgi:DNA (cytosine-5)-methyltransferase 1